jgi:hypothetical protein
MGRQRCKLATSLLLIAYARTFILTRDYYVLHTQWAPPRRAMGLAGYYALVLNWQSR